MSQGEGHRPAAAEMVARDAAIMASLHSGERVKDIAARHELTTRQVQRIAKAWRLRPSGLERKPMEIAERILREYEQQMVLFSVVVQQSIAKQPAVAVAALRGKSEMLERYREVLTDIGKLPSDLEIFRTEAEVERLGLAMLDVLERATQGELTTVDAHERIRRLLESGPPQADFDVDAFSEPEEAGDG